MTKQEAIEAVTWFGELFPTLTPEQGRALRDAIERYPKSAFEEEARLAFGAHQYVADAVVAIQTKLRLRFVRSATSVTREELTRMREAAEPAIRQEREDRALCERLSDAEYMEHVEALASVEKIPNYDQIKARGRLRVSPMVIGLVAQRVRMVEEVRG